MTVFVTQETNHDFTSAEAFGDIVFLTHEDLRNIKGSPHNDHVLAEVRHKLLRYDPDTDWVVIAGSPYVSAAVFMMLGKKYQTVRVLRWDNRDYRYIPMQIEL